MEVKLDQIKVRNASPKADGKLRKIEKTWTRIVTVESWNPGKTQNKELNCWAKDPKNERFIKRKNDLKGN